MHLSLLQEATELRMSGPAEDGKVRTSMALWAFPRNKTQWRKLPLQCPKHWAVPLLGAPVCIRLLKCIVAALSMA